MVRFWEAVIEPVLEAARPHTVIEIGAWRGESTEKLLGLCRRHGATLHVIDPAPAFDTAAFEAEYGKTLELHRALSLDALPRISPADVVLIDGDHNWHTVHNELLLLDEAADRSGTSFPLVLLHDLSWPYGGRDLYYDTDAVPDAGRHPSRRAGMVPGRSALVPDGGLNRRYANAEVEGGPRNGVLTAIEDFMEAVRPDLRLLTVPGMHGLGVLYSQEHADDDLLGPQLAHFKEERFMRGQSERIEEERIRLLVTVEELSSDLKQARRAEKALGRAVEAALEELRAGAATPAAAHERTGLRGALRGSRAASERARAEAAAASAARILDSVRRDRRHG